MMSRRTPVQVGIQETGNGDKWCNSNQVNLDQKETNLVRLFSRKPANSTPLLKLEENLCTYNTEHLILNT